MAELVSRTMNSDRQESFACVERHETVVHADLHALEADLVHTYEQIYSQFTA